MIISALISQCRREFMDEPKSIRVSRQADGSVNLFNLGKFPIIEGSYTIYQNTSAKTEGSGAGKYTLDKDNGDLRFANTPANGINVISEHKYAFWRDQHWLEALNQGIDALNGRGFFRQVERNTSIIRLSSNVQSYSGPSACVDMYQFLVSDTYISSGSYVKPGFNWRYEQDANKLLIGLKPSQLTWCCISYLRNLQKATATSSTIDVLSDWEELVRKYAGSLFYRSLAGKIAKEGNASIDEGHFSFTNLRAMANDLSNEFEKLSLRKKPVRPAKDIGYWDPIGGNP